MSFAIHWDADGTASVVVQSPSGQGQLTDITPAAIMSLAVAFARSGSSHGAAWPEPVWDDRTVTDLRTIIDPSPSASTSESALVMVQEQIAALRAQLYVASARLSETIAALP
jgi:hypothetical protein